MAPVHGDRSLGEYLRSQRAGAGVSLADIARATRINQQHLSALESGDFSQLPPPVFVKGFIRAYSDVLGIPADTALALYHAESGVPTRLPTRISSPRPPASWIGHPLTVSVALLIVFGAGVLALNVMARPPSRPVPMEPAQIQQGGARDRMPGAPPAPPGNPHVLSQGSLAEQRSPHP